MSDIEERPSKIRRVELEDSNDSCQSPSVLTNTDEKKPEGSSGLAEGEANSTLEAEGQAIAEAKPTISKNQLKKIRRQEQWEAGKDYRKTKRREKHKEKQARKAAAAQEAIKNGADVPKELPPAVDNKQRSQRPIQVPVSLIMDCDFTEFMTEKELISLGAQLTRCYSDNKTSTYRSHMAISSWGGSLKTRFETVLSNQHANWRGMRFLEADFQGAAEVLDAVMRGPEGGKLAGALSKEQSKTSENKPAECSAEEAVPGESQESGSAPMEKGTEDTAAKATTETAQETHEPSIVYLTSDSPNTLDVLSPNTSYIIGGIVDKNRHKGICYKRACERGLPTAKLPIGEFMTMQSRTVLAVNHVVEIMLKWLETGDWGEAFLSVIPKRKEAKLKVNKNGDAGDSESIADGEDAEAEGDGGVEQTVEGMTE